MSVKTVVVAGFPGVGKSWCVDMMRDKYRMIDSDSSFFSWIYKDGVKTTERDPNFPDNYIKHIKENIGKVDVIFVSTHKVVREALAANKIPYVLVYPEDESLTGKIYYLARYVKRGSDDAFINMMKDNWEEFLGELMMETWPTHYVLDNNEKNIQNLSDVIEDIIAVNS